MAMLVIAWLFSLALIFAYMFAMDLLLSRLPINWWLLLTGLAAFWAFLTLIASSIFVDHLGDVKVNSLADVSQQATYINNLGYV